MRVPGPGFLVGSVDLEVESKGGGGDQHSCGEIS